MHSCLFAFVGGLIGALAGCSSAHIGHPGTPAPVTVQTATPVRHVFRGKIEAFGQVAADRRSALSLSLPQAGQVLAIKAIAGQHVQRGKALLQLTTDPATRSAYLHAKNALAVARSDLDRITHLHSDKLATNAQLDAARTAVSDAQAALEAQALLGGGDAVATLRAPADGVVTALPVQRGERVAAGTQLIGFTPDAALSAQLAVDPVSAPDIRVGMPVTIHPVYAAPGAPPLAATVAAIGSAVDAQTHMVDIVATFDARAPLQEGAAIAAIIHTTKEPVWAVPRSALQHDAHGNYVFQIEDGKAHRVDVTVLAPDGSPVGVAGKLDPHAAVITLGSYETADGQPVRAAAPTAPRTAGTTSR
ncbi:MAG TPA: efflux RND transporter periplasmic adaptor subunit [Rhodanobacteraceae bacterium]|nr:efflux RND transporter periplasmic adaptor subunit [Rhodanobacteraceae bacterium]